MAQCKSCGHEFHVCSSCCLSSEWEHEFCSERCWHMSMCQSVAKFQSAVEKGDLAEVGKMLVEFPYEELDYIGSHLLKVSEVIHET